MPAFFANVGNCLAAKRKLLAGDLTCLPFFRPRGAIRLGEPPEFAAGQAVYALAAVAATKAGCRCHGFIILKIKLYGNLTSILHSQDVSFYCSKVFKL